jgi:hypothetical protein
MGAKKLQNAANQDEETGNVPTQDAGLKLTEPPLTGEEEHKLTTSSTADDKEQEKEVPVKENVTEPT